MTTTDHSTELNPSDPDGQTATLVIDKKTKRRVAAASTIGTTIEFYDFYAYAAAAVVVFPSLFFPANDNPTVNLLASFATFGLAFVARPLGSIIFGHFGDRVGRKATLIGSLLTMGIATILIGLLPTYGQVALAVNGLALRCWLVKTRKTLTALVLQCGHSWVHRLVSSWPMVSCSFWSVCLPIRTAIFTARS